LKNRIDYLSSTLSQCAFDNKKIKIYKQDSHYAHTSQHTHSHPTHHANMYARVYTYTHCSRKNHLAKFCFDRLNILNVNVCVHDNINLQGPKKMWVPKGTPNLFDVGVSALKM